MFTVSGVSVSRQITVTTRARNMLLLQVREAVSVFDADRDGRITLNNVVDSIVRIYKVSILLMLSLCESMIRPGRRTKLCKQFVYDGSCLAGLCKIRLPRSPVSSCARYMRVALSPGSAARRTASRPGCDTLRHRFP